MAKPIREVGRSKSEKLRRNFDTCVSNDSYVPKDTKSPKLFLPNGKSLSKSNFGTKIPSWGFFGEHEPIYFPT